MVKLVSIENSRGALLVTESFSTLTEASEFYSLLCNMEQIEMPQYRCDYPHDHNSFEIRYWISAE